MTNKEKIDRLRPFVSEHKQVLIDRISRKRTRHITLVFEDIEKPHNISAVLRTAECLGIQDLHFIRNKKDYRINKDITKGSANWLTLHRHNEFDNGTDNIDDAFRKLRLKGYKIFATSLATDAKSIYDVPTDQKLAIVFGTEGRGISQDAKGRADGLMKIPMMGFTGSFNLSVSAAIILTILMQNVKEHWYLNENEREELIANWYRNAVKEADKILARG